MKKLEPPILTKQDRAFLHGGSEADQQRLPEGREKELLELCFWEDEEEISDTLCLIVVRTPDGSLWGYCQGIYPGEDNWYDEAPLFPVEAKEVVRTIYTQPGGKELPDSVLRCSC